MINLSYFSLLLTMVCLSCFVNIIVSAEASDFRTDEAFRVTSIAPILNEDVYQAHQTALESAFRQALKSASRKFTTDDQYAKSPLYQEMIRYIMAYQIEEQSKKDLYYRLTILIWVDTELLEKDFHKGADEYMPLVIDRLDPEE